MQPTRPDDWEPQAIPYTNSDDEDANDNLHDHLNPGTAAQHCPVRPRNVTTPAASLGRGFHTLVITLFSWAACALLVLAVADIVHQALTWTVPPRNPADADAAARLGTAVGAVLRNADPVCTGHANDGACPSYPAMLQLLQRTHELLSFPRSQLQHDYQTWLVAKTLPKRDDIADVINGYHAYYTAVWDEVTDLAWRGAAADAARAHYRTLVAAAAGPKYFVPYYAGEPALWLLQRRQVHTQLQQDEMELEHERRPLTAGMGDGEVDGNDNGSSAQYHKQFIQQLAVMCSAPETGTHDLFPASDGDAEGTATAVCVDVDRGRTAVRPRPDRLIPWLADLGHDHDQSLRPTPDYYTLKQFIKETTSGVELACWRLSEFADRMERQTRHERARMRAKLEAARRARQEVRKIWALE
ncbi:hypothetical protein P8C59_006458 [Phyllachora maydis]|uniref:Uncharacterized protein n=1 Tax=Phyllachora maydis TaxID=1825666 RepID=A0AAD9I863_9PEZI|nr:hypothetical protein P8C59_006458 [Phyllachora maydis]